MTLTPAGGSANRTKPEYLLGTGASCTKPAGTPLNSGGSSLWRAASSVCAAFEYFPLGCEKYLTADLAARERLSSTSLRWVSLIR